MAPSQIAAILVIVAAFFPSPAAAQTPDEPAAVAPPSAKKNPYTSEADVRRGAMFVRAYCSVCHGPEGRGGRGPDLTSGVLRRGASDEAILKNIKNGIPGTDMIAFGEWDEDDQSFWQVIAYIRSATGPPPLPPSGDKENGRHLVVKHNCSNCHWMEGRGGRRGPDLGASGASIAHLRESIVDPDANFRAEPAFQHDPYQLVSVLTLRGATIQGRWLNENGYFVLLIDEKEQLRTLAKMDLEVISKPRQSLMPSFADLVNDRELDDLIAYVYSLRPQPKPMQEGN